MTLFEQRSSIVDPFSNYAHLHGVDLAKFGPEIIQGVFPEEFLPLFLHEFTHHWCFNSTVGNVLAALQARSIQTYLISGDIDICASDIRDATYVTSLLQPFAEGLALFAEYDTQPGPSLAVSMPVHYATHLFGNLRGIPNPHNVWDIFAESLRRCRRHPASLARKRDLFARPLSWSDGGYLLGYLVIRHLYESLVDSCPAFVDKDLFLCYMRSFVYDDYGLVQILLDDNRQSAERLSTIADYIGTRLALLIESKSILHHRVRTFEGILAGTGDPDNNVSHCILSNDIALARGDYLLHELENEFLTPTFSDDDSAVAASRMTALLGHRFVFRIADLRAKIRIFAGGRAVATIGDMPLLSLPANSTEGFEMHRGTEGDGIIGAYLCTRTGQLFHALAIGDTMVALLCPSNPIRSARTHLEDFDPTYSDVRSCHNQLLDGPFKDVITTVILEAQQDAATLYLHKTMASHTTCFGNMKQAGLFELFEYEPALFDAFIAIDTCRSAFHDAVDVAKELKTICNNPMEAVGHVKRAMKRYDLPLFPRWNDRDWTQLEQLLQSSQIHGDLNLRQNEEVHDDVSYYAWWRRDNDNQTHGPATRSLAERLDNLSRQTSCVEERTFMTRVVQDVARGNKLVEQAKYHEYLDLWSPYCRSELWSVNHKCWSDKQLIKNLIHGARCNLVLAHAQLLEKGFESIDAFDVMVSEIKECVTVEAWIPTIGGDGLSEGEAVQENMGYSRFLNTAEAWLAYVANQDGHITSDVGIQKLRKEVETRQESVIDALLRMPSFLLERWSALSDQIKVAALRRRDLIESSATVGFLLSAMDDDSSIVRGLAASRVGELRDSTTFDILGHMLLHDVHEEPRIDTALALAHFGEDAVTLLLRGFADKADRVRRNVVWALKRTGSDRGIPVLITALKDPSIAVRRAAVEAIGELKIKAAADSVIELLEDSDVEVRDRAIDSLVNIGSEKCVDSLIRCLEHRDSQTRNSAAFKLGSFADQKAVEPLIRHLNDPDTAVRMNCAMSLGQLKAAGAVQALTGLLDDANSHVRLYSAFALAMCNVPNALDRVIEALNDPDFSIRLRACEFLGEIGDTRSVPALIAQLNTDAAANAAFALGHLPDERSLNALRACIRHEDPAVRLNAVCGLGRMAAKSAVEDLRWLENNETTEEVRNAAKNVVAELVKT